MIRLKLRSTGGTVFAELPPSLSQRERDLLLTQALADAQDNALLDHPRSVAGRALLAERRDVLRRRGLVE